MTSHETLEQVLSAAKSDIDCAVELLDRAHQRLYTLSALVEKSAGGVLVPEDLSHEPQAVSSD